MTPRCHRSIALMLALCAVISFLAGCSTVESKKEALADEMLDSMDEMVAILDSVTDEATAREAVTKLEALSAKMNGLIEKGNAMGDPSPELKTRMEDQFRAKQAELQVKMMAFQQRMMANPKLMEILGPALQGFGESLEK